MPEIGVKELSVTVSAVIEQVEAESAYLVTKRGRPDAVLLPIGEGGPRPRERGRVRADASGGPWRLREGTNDEPQGPGLTA